jgi:hypothetical protein
MRSDQRWWTLSRRRRIVVAAVTVGSGMGTFVAAGLGLGEPDLWPDVPAMALTVAGLGMLIALIGAPITGDRPDWRNPIPALDTRTKRRALRCIRHRTAAGAPAEVDLDQFAFYWGRQAARTFRWYVGGSLIFLGGTLLDTDRWTEIFRVAALLLFAGALVFAVRDLRRCRRYLILGPTRQPDQSRGSGSLR